MYIAKPIRKIYDISKLLNISKGCPVKKMEKEKIIKHLNALNRYNQWEDTLSIPMDPEKRISLVSGLYELIPKKNRQRTVNTDGIIQMRQALSLLKSVKK